MAIGEKKSFPNCLTGLNRTNKQILYLHIHPQAVALVVRSTTTLIVMISMYIEKRGTDWNVNRRRARAAFKRSVSVLWP